MMICCMLFILIHFDTSFLLTKINTVMYVDTVFRPKFSSLNKFLQEQLNVNMGREEIIQRLKDESTQREIAKLEAVSLKSRMDACVKFRSKLLDIRNRNKFCDVNVRVQDVLFPCHRLVLSAASEYFEVMFGGDFQEKDSQETTLHDIDEKTFRTVLDYMYLGDCTISVENVYQLLRASSFLRIDSIENGCTDFILKNLSSLQDHIEIFVLARSLNMTILIEALSIHIVQNFKSFYDDERFLGMPFDDLQSILSKWEQDKLPVKHENLLLDLLIRWVHFTPEDRRKYLSELVQVVDFERISPQYITFMLEYFKNLTEIPSDGETSTQDVCMIKEGELNDSMPKDWSTIQDSQSRWLLKKTMVEYFVKNEQFSSNCEDMTPVLIPSAKSYRHELGLHIYMECTRHYSEWSSEGNVPAKERLKNAKVLSMNKYEPDWFNSCETNAWYRCQERKMVSQEPGKFLYCLETYRDDYTTYSGIVRQTFCTYISTDMGLASNILSPPPITVSNFNMCAVRNNIYGLNTLGFTLSSEKNLNEAFFRYNCEVDKWFPAKYCQSLKNESCLAVDNNLLYVISDCTVQAFDDRDGKWMNIPNCRMRHSYRSQSCILNEKLYITNGDAYIENFDMKARKWGILGPWEIPSVNNSFFLSPRSRIQKVLAYDNMLWVIADGLENCYFGDYCTATYNFISKEWYVSKKLNEALPNFQPEAVGCEFYTWKMKDAPLCKMATHCGIM